MSSRQPANRERIERFLRELGSRFKGPGRLDVFHFDLYSTALSKIARGTEEDLRDVAALARTKRIDWATLEKYYQEIRPRVATESLKQDPVDFDRNLEAVRKVVNEAL